MLYVILLATFSLVFGSNEYCYTSGQCARTTIIADTVTCVATYACAESTITADVLECNSAFACRLIDATVTDSAVCNGNNACTSSEIEVSGNCDETGIIYCTGTTGPSCQLSTLTSDSVVCDGSTSACAGSTITANSLDCTVTDGCSSTTVTFSGNSDYSSITISASGAADDSTLVQTDGDSDTSYTLDVFLNDNYDAVYANFYSGDYNYMNVYYNAIMSGAYTNFYCEAYSTCNIYCTGSPWHCMNSNLFYDSTSTVNIVGLYSPRLISSSTQKLEKNKLKAQQKLQQNKDELLSKIQTSTNNINIDESQTSNTPVAVGKTMEETKELYKQKKEEKNKFIIKMKTKLAKNSIKKIHFNNYYSTIYFVIIGTLLFLSGMITQYAIPKMFCRSKNKDEYQPLKSDTQYV